MQKRLKDLGSHIERLAGDGETDQTLVPAFTNSDGLREQVCKTCARLGNRGKLKIVCCGLASG